MIADNYQCELSDITSNNLHITDFKNLKPGMKLKIPFLTKPIMEVLEETESFISDYYPTLNTDFKETKNKDEVVKEESVTLDVVKMEENIAEDSKVIDEEVPILRKEETANKVVEDNNTVIKSKIPYYGNVIPKIDQKYIKKI
jgi:hypothetical protein